MRTGSIYIIKNKINKKVYIGQTTMTVRERFMTHMKPCVAKRNLNRKIYNAIKKYGRQNFYVEKLETNIKLEELDSREIYYIDLYDSYNNGYNSSLGGDGRIINLINHEEDILKLAAEGVSANELAKKYDVHVATILRTLHKMNFYYRKKIDENDLKNLIEKGFNNTEIAEFFNVDKATITRARDKYGVRAHRKFVKCRENFDLESFRDDFETGMDRTELCLKYNIARTTMYRLAKEYSLLNCKIKRSSEITEEIYKQYEAGTSVKTLTKKYAIKEKSIYNRIEWYRKNIILKK